MPIIFPAEVQLSRQQLLRFWRIICQLDDSDIHCPSIGRLKTGVLGLVLLWRSDVLLREVGSSVLGSCLTLKNAAV